MQMVRTVLKDALPTQQQQQEKQDPRSKQLIKLLTRVPAVPIKKLEDWRDKIFELSRNEGFDDMLTGKWIRGSMSEAGYSRRHIERILPDTAKQDYNRYQETESDILSDYQESVTGSEQEQDEQAPIEDEAPTGYYQGSVEEFKIEWVEQYDRIYLIKVVKEEHKQNQEKDKKIRELLATIERLENKK